MVFDPYYGNEWLTRWVNDNRTFLFGWTVPIRLVSEINWTLLSKLFDICASTIFLLGYFSAPLLNILDLFRSLLMECECHLYYWDFPWLSRSRNQVMTKTMLLVRSFNPDLNFNGLYLLVRTQSCVNNNLYYSCQFKHIFSSNTH